MTSLWFKDSTVLWETPDGPVLWRCMPHVEAVKAPVLQPRTSLGYGLLGPVAPPRTIRASITLTGPGAMTYDPRNLRITLPDGTVVTGEALEIERLNMGNA